MIVHSNWNFLPIHFMFREKAQYFVIFVRRTPNTCVSLKDVESLTRLQPLRPRSNLKYHLTSVHKVINLRVVQNTEVKIVQFFKKAAQSSISKQLPKSMVIDCYLMAAMDLVAFNTVEHKGLRVLFDKYCQNVRLPSRSCIQGRCLDFTSN